MNDRLDRLLLVLLCVVLGAFLHLLMSSCP